MNNTTSNPLYRSDSENILLSLNNLTLHLGKKKILDQVNTQFRKGEAVLIAGNNGSGKSSLLRCIAGIYLPDSGTVEFGKNITPKKIGFISDKISLFEQFTLKQGIEFHCKTFDIEKFDDTLLKYLNLQLSQPIKSLSTGERALYLFSLLKSQKPELLMIDEIIHTIDPFIRELFLEAIIDLIDESNTTVIMVNHTFSEMGRIPERILIMENGKFVIDEKAEDLSRKMKKIITPSDVQLPTHYPIIFKKQSSIFNEYYIYPISPTFEASSEFELLEIELAEILKSFIGGYYARKK